MTGPAADRRSTPWNEKDTGKQQYFNCDFKIMKDIILVNGYRTDCPFLPVGIGYVAQAIEDAGFDYDVCDVNLQTPDQILQIIHYSKAKFVGCGTMTYEVEKNYELLQAIRECMPDTIIILGGPHAIAAQSEIFQECPAIDLVIQGEGEEAIVKLLQGAACSTIPGVLAKDSQAELIPYELLHIDSVAFPKYHRFDLERYGNTMFLASSRGCVYNCSFCGAPKFLGKRWRAFKRERMIEEFEYWYGKGYRHFYFSDSLFVLDKKRIADFCKYIIESGYKDVVFTADGLRADHLTLEILQHLKEAHFKFITLGVESVNDETLKFFNKGETFNQIDNALSMADSLSFDISIYLVIGAPNESYDDAIKSIRYPLRYKNINSSIVSKLMPIRGTSYYEYAVEHNLVKDKSVYYPKHEAYGTNERQNTHNPVEQIWESLLPEIERVSSLLSRRNQVKGELACFGFDKVAVNKLNMLARISFNPVVAAIASASIRVAKSMGLR